MDGWMDARARSRSNWPLARSTDPQTPPQNHARIRLSTIGFRELNCRTPAFTHGGRDVGFWTMLFIFSKLFELIDTVFIVLRKRPLLFLHWYHHITVLLFCWYSSAFRHAGLVFVAMNYSVHAAMYSYFFLMALKKVPKWFNPIWITLAQISQVSPPPHQKK